MRLVNLPPFAVGCSLPLLAAWLWLVGPSAAPPVAPVLAVAALAMAVAWGLYLLEVIRLSVEHPEAVMVGRPLFALVAGALVGCLVEGLVVALRG